MPGVFVFGSNLAGRHGAGAARFARTHRGAIYGLGVGRQGNSYAIPTKDSKLATLPLHRIALYVEDFIEGLGFPFGDVAPNLSKHGIELAAGLRIPLDFSVPFVLLCELVFCEPRQEFIQFFAWQGLYLLRELLDCDRHTRGIPQDQLDIKSPMVPRAWCRKGGRHCFGLPQPPAPPGGTR